MNDLFQKDKSAISLLGALFRHLTSWPFRSICDLDLVTFPWPLTSPPPPKSPWENESRKSRENLTLNSILFWHRWSLTSWNSPTKQRDKSARFGSRNYATTHSQGYLVWQLQRMNEWVYWLSLKEYLIRDIWYGRVSRIGRLAHGDLRVP